MTGLASSAQRALQRRHDSGTGPSSEKCADQGSSTVVEGILRRWRARLGHPGGGGGFQTGCRALEVQQRCRPHTTTGSYGMYTGLCLRFPESGSKQPHRNDDVRSVRHMPPLEQSCRWPSQATWRAAAPSEPTTVYRMAIALFRSACSSRAIYFGSGETVAWRRGAPPSAAARRGRMNPATHKSAETSCLASHR